MIWSRKVDSGGSIMLLKIRSVLNWHHLAFSLRVFGYPVFAFSFGRFVSWFRIFNHGLSVTTKPRFSVRNGYKKTMKIGKVYFELL
jgi:hypothetical protein